LDFSKSHLTYKGHDITKFAGQSNSERGGTEDLADRVGQMSLKSGPPFRTVYKIFGPTTPGEYIPPSSDASDISDPPESVNGTYVLSYPGIAFSFPLQAGRWSSTTTWASTVSLLSSSATSPATSLCIFMGESWPIVRGKLFSAEIPPSVLRSPVPPGLRKDHLPKEIESARVYDRGRIELVRRDAPNIWIVLGETTAQDLVTELGPPDNIHKRNDRRVAIHRARKGSETVHSRRGSSTSAVQVDPSERGTAFIDSDPSSRGGSSGSDDEDEDDENVIVEGKKSTASEQVFYNYYSHGFDILIAPPTAPSSASPTADQVQHARPRSTSVSSTSPQNLPIPADSTTDPVLPRSHLTATKILFHGNVPGSWPFNRHRRLRWTLESVPISDADADASPPVTSETSWRDIQRRLAKVFRDHYDTAEAARIASLPMVVNRGWGREEVGTDSEWGVVGGWEDGGAGAGAGASSMVRKVDGSQDSAETERLGAAEVYGFPGLVFEVLKNGAVSCLMVY
jgi:isoleucyl-tRNA synthetase